MKKIISFSLWGNNFRYTGGAIQNAELAKIYYPDWTCRFYIGNSTSSGIIHKLSKFTNVEIIEMQEDEDWTSSFWRFYALEDTQASIILLRDTDSRLGKREKWAVDEWIKSDKQFHIIRDHPYHSGFPIMAGMWGAKNCAIKNIKELIKNYKNLGNFYTTDQMFLADIVYPTIKNNCVVHDEFVEKKPFPILSGNRNNAFFVGQAYDGDGSVLDTKQYGKIYYKDLLLETENIKYESAF
ncbi:MAG: hypothetical protein JSV62_04885 [Promethearchaeota archaeon]|nr:MAG: hypothetical protein JSV62_04885 [Candidatus Lokiarchaeota archaeon]